MNMTRRGLGLGGLAMAMLAGCGGGPLVRGGPSGERDPGLRPQPNADYDAWVVAFRGRAQAAGITRSTLDSAFAGAGFLPGVVERDRNQTEFTRTLEDYLAIVAPEEKVQFGRGQVATQRNVLARVEDTYGVPPEVIGALWGMESYFGTRRGTINVFSATSTLAWEGRRGTFFEAQLMSALRLLQAGDARASEMVGSWAGTMGHTQMMPDVYETYAVDFDGDGRRHIWGDDPADALASTARFLERRGWRRGQPWGLEVIVPAGYSGPTGRGSDRPVSSWRAAGIVPARGGALPEAGEAALLIPEGPGTPAFLVYHNFEVIRRYNPSTNYALALGYLSGRLAGGGPLVGEFGPDANGLTLEDRKSIQTGLSRRGYDAGTADGVVGDRTEAAISAWQRDQGLPVTGEPSRALLASLS